MVPVGGVFKHPPTLILGSPGATWPPCQDPGSAGTLHGRAPRDPRLAALSGRPPERGAVQPPGTLRNFQGGCNRCAVFGARVRLTTAALGRTAGAGCAALGLAAPIGSARAAGGGAALSAPKRPCSSSAARSATSAAPLERPSSPRKNSRAAGAEGPSFRCGAASGALPVGATSSPCGPGSRASSSSCRWRAWRRPRPPRALRLERW